MCYVAPLYNNTRLFETNRFRKFALDPPLWTVVPNKALSLSLSRFLLFITAVPNTKLYAWGEEDSSYSGGHVL
jgi:hypothetical protein